MLVTESAVNDPVSLQEVKVFLELDDDFTQYDTLLSSLITKARKTCEAYTNCSLVEKDIIARWEAAATEELPCGPVNSIDSVKDGSGNVLDASSYTREGILGAFVKLRIDRELPTEVSYNAGYSEVPEGFKVAIMKQVCDDFEQRTGFDLSGRLAVQSFPNNWKEAIKQYRRITWLG